MEQAASRLRTCHDALGNALYAWVAFWILEACAVAIFWAFDALPFMDLPGHAGILALQHRFDPAGFEGRFFTYAPHLGPYSLFRVLGSVLTDLFGAVDAVRILATLPVLLMPLAAIYARVRLFGSASVTGAFVALMMSLGYMTLAGFASYLIAIAVLIVAFTEWLILIGRADSGRATWPGFLIAALLATATFVAHGFAFIELLFVAGFTAAFIAKRRSSSRQLAAFLPALLVAAYSFLAERGLAVEVTQRQLVPPMKFQGPLDKIGLLITPTLMTRTGIDAIICILLWLGISYWSVATYRSRQRVCSPDDERSFYSRALVWTAMASVLLFFVLPHSIGWFGFVDGRLLPLIMLLLVVGIEDDIFGNTWKTAACVATGLAAAAIVCLSLVASHLFQAEARGYHEVFAEIPAFTRLLNLPLNPDSKIFTSHPFVHYDKLVLVQRPIVASDVWFHQGTAIYPTGSNPSLRLPLTYSSSDLREIDWNLFVLDDWDHFLIRTEPGANAPPTPARLELIRHAGGWWLFRNVAAKPLPAMGAAFGRDQR